MGLIAELWKGMPEELYGLKETKSNMSFGKLLKKDFWNKWLLL